MAIRLELLRTFVTVARAGELAQAANKLCRTPSAVSMSLKQLQDELGIALFETDRKTRLTKVGGIVFAEAERAISSFDHSVTTIVHHARAEAGFIRVAAVPSIATTLLPLTIKMLIKSAPGIRIDLRDMDSRSVVNELLAERIDVGIATSGDARQGIDTELLWEDRFEVLLPDNHHLAKAKFLSVQDISGEVFITNGLCELIDHPKVHEMVLNSHISVRNTTSLMSMVREGIGITLLPKMIERQATTGVKFVLLRDVESTRRLDILTPANIKPSPAIIQFLKILREAAASLQLKGRS